MCDGESVVGSRVVYTGVAMGISRKQKWLWYSRLEELYSIKILMP